MKETYNKNIVFGLAYLLRYGYLAIVILLVLFEYILQLDGLLFRLAYITIIVMALHMILSALTVRKHFIAAYQNIMGDEMNPTKKYKIEEIRRFQTNYVISAILLVVMASFIMFFGL